jgi:hypothetical protein
MARGGGEQEEMLDKALITVCIVILTRITHVPRYWGATVGGGGRRRNFVMIMSGEDMDGLDLQ